VSAAWKAGVPCGFEEAIEAAAAQLAAARLPLVYGLVQSTVEAQREAVRLARLLRGVLDSASAGPAGHLAFARLGLRSASLGELRRRADLVLFWGCDPDAFQPGFVERYAPARQGRTRLAVDLGDARGPAGTDLRVAVPREREIEALLVLRAFVRGRRVEREVAAPLGLPLDTLRGLASRLKACRHAALLYDGDPPLARRDAERAASLTSLALDARPGTSLRVLAVRESGNPVGAESVLTWLTGCPAAVSFAQGAPRFGPREWSAEAVLAAGDVDAALLVGVGSPRQLSARALDQLGRLPTVWVGSEGGLSTRASVAIAAAPLAATPGHVFRMDGVALRPVALAEDPGGLPTEASVLARIAAALPRPRAESRA
jgi:formylmethanofuran dehydrogenase subunit B